MGRATTGTLVECPAYSGVISYEPTELYITARAGTLLSEINNTLSEHGQMLAFDPPKLPIKQRLVVLLLQDLSGSRRPYSGSVRDYVLGIRCINGWVKICHLVDR